MTAQSFRKVGCAAGRIHTMKCSFLFRTVPDVFPPPRRRQLLRVEIYRLHWPHIGAPHHTPKPTSLCCIVQGHHCQSLNHFKPVHPSNHNSSLNAPDRTPVPCVLQAGS